MLIEYRRVKRADVVEFFDYDKGAIQAMLNMQKVLDSGLKIPNGYTVDELLDNILVVDTNYSEFFTMAQKC